jgi:hypothetical protein
VWPEAFGLVATEACARGIPCVSSTHGGLIEANVLATTPEFSHFAVPTPIFHDKRGAKMLHGVYRRGASNPPRVPHALLNALRSAA